VQDCIGRAGCFDSHMPESSLRLWACFCLLLVGGTEGAAQIKLEPAVLDLGRVGQRETFARTVTLTNTSRAVWEILAIQTDCACTAVTPKTKRLAPGESTAVSVVVESRSFQGQVVRQIAVQTTAGDAEFSVRMNVAPLGNWNIGAFPVMFPRSLLAQETKMGVRLSYAGEGRVELLTAAADVSWLDVTIAALDAPNAYELRLTKRPMAAPAGLLSATVRVTTSSRDQPVLTIPILTPVTSAAHLVPDPVVLPTVRVGEDSSGTFRIVDWVGQNPPAAHVAGGKITPVGVVDGAYAFTLTMRPQTAGMQVETLQVYDGQMMQIEVPVVLRAEP
jgi:hypothetical protein